MKTALLVIDVQNGFIKTQTKHLPRLIVRHIKQSKYDHVLFAKFVNKLSSMFVLKLEWNKLFKSPDIDIAQPLSSYANSKNTFSRTTYSAFKNTKLVNFLKKNKTHKVVLCGLELDGCVLASAYEAFDLGFEVKVLTKLSLSSTTLNKASINILNRNIDRKILKRKL